LISQLVAYFSIYFYSIVAVHRSSSTMDRKRYYDTWEANNVDGESVNTGRIGNKGSNKYDPCENKPLWFLKSQARLGKLSPFYDCLNDYRVARK
jgi:hypothetical protein